MNPERILIAAEAVGIGLAALRKAAGYARERIVFRRPIGQNQGIAHPLARCWMNLEAANLMVMKAASLYDRDADCAAEANAAKYLAAEAAFEVRAEHGDAAFWTMHDKLLSAQKDLAPAVLARLAGESGASAERVRVAVTAHRHRALIGADEDPVAYDWRDTALSVVLRGDEIPRGDTSGP